MKRFSGLIILIILAGCASSDDSSVASSGRPSLFGAEPEPVISVIDDLATDGVIEETDDIENVAPATSTAIEEGLLDHLVQDSEATPNDPKWAPIEPQAKPDHYVAASGSLFSAENSRDLYDDARPRGLGDIITVMLDESTSATKNATADLSKQNDAILDPVTMGGEELVVDNSSLSYGLNNANNFSGSSAANQSNNLSGTITVEVVDVLNNGNLVIRGEKWLTLNTGNEYIRLSGVIRPDDIGAENMIASNRISNARIEYSGTGSSKDTQEPGLLARFFNSST